MIKVYNKEIKYNTYLYFYKIWSLIFWFYDYKYEQWYVWLDWKYHIDKIKIWNRIFKLNKKQTFNLSDPLEKQL